MENVILASTSEARAAMLRQAGVPFTAVNARVDEDAAKGALRAQGLGARDLADALAELKALRASDHLAGSIVLGCDQTLELDDGTMLDKPGSHLAQQLRQLSGKSHRLHSACVAAEGGRPVWRHVETVTLTMRALTTEFIDHYVAEQGLPQPTLWADI